MNRLLSGLCILSIFLCTACSNTKNLPQGDSLYLGPKVRILDDEADKTTKRTLTSDLSGQVRPKPNAAILGVRLKLTLWNLAPDTTKKGFLRKAVRKLGQPPVLASAVDLQRNEQLMENLLENRGFFYPAVSSRLETKKRKSRAIFEVTTGPQYKIRNVVFPDDSTTLGRDMQASKAKSLLKPGLPYNLDLIKGERARIDRELTEQGYYYFRPDYLIVLVDSSAGRREVDLYVQPKTDNVPKEAFQTYTINRIFLYPNYRVNAIEVDTQKAEAEAYKHYFVVDKRKTFRPLVFEQAMQFRPGELYNRTEQNRSLNRLVSLGTFKFVRSRFEPVNSNSDDPKLDVHYYLTPSPKKSIRFEAGVQTQNDSRVGSQTSLSWRNRNTFRGAEQLAVTLRFGYEAQSGGNIQRPPTFEGGADVTLSVPRFVIPFIKVTPSSLFIPRTNFRVGYDATLRQDLYLIHSGRVSYGYIFKEDVRKEHQFFPINVTYVRTDTLGIDTRQRSINFSNLVFNGLIIGPTYEYTYNGQARGLKRNNWYFNGLADFSNNILGLVQGASTEQPRQIFGTTYAQYMKFQVDGRYFLNYGRNKTDMWANRIIIGYGIPYGNSTQLPNIKQFFSGGNSSLRGFRSRLVGPGRFNALERTDGRQVFIETLGDIKLELNTEFRKNIYQFLNVAAFADAGNIWTASDDPRFPGGKFTGDFYKEIAMNVGIGLRLDFQILLLRLDLGMPIYKPWLPEGDRWVLNQIQFGDKSWRSNNLIFNIAIGYPF